MRINKQGKKVLELEIVRQTSTLITFKISNQSHKGSDFHKDYFYCKNGWRMASRQLPEIVFSKKTFYVRGAQSHQDRCLLNAGPEIFEEINEAVAEYNKFYNDNDNVDTIFPEQITYVRSLRGNILRKKYKDTSRYHYIYTEFSDLEDR